MTWIAGSGNNDWHYITELGGKGVRATTACGMVFAERDESNMFSGEDEPEFRIFDPPVPICKKCRDWRTMKELAE